MIEHQNLGLRVIGLNPIRATRMEISAIGRASDSGSEGYMFEPCISNETIREVIP